MRNNHIDKRHFRYNMIYNILDYPENHAYIKTEMKLSILGDSVLEKRCIPD